MSKRSSYVDVIKGLAIIAVVYGHAAGPNIQIVYLYHLALFFFISGYLLKKEDTKRPSEYIFKKIKNLIFPTIKYYIIFTCFHNLFLKLKIYVFPVGNTNLTEVYKYDFENFIGALTSSLTMNTWEPIAGSMWFIKPLFMVMIFLSLIFYFTDKITDNKTIKFAMRNFIILFVGIIGCKFVDTNHILPWRSEISFLVIPLVYLGYLIKEYAIGILKNKIILIVACIIFVINIKLNTVIDLGANIIGNPINFYLVSLSGIYLNFYIAKILSKSKKIEKVLATIGNKSFHIMALHILSFKLINIIDVILNNKEKIEISRYPVSNSNLYIWYSIVGIVLPIILLKIIDIFSGKLTELKKKKLEKNVRLKI
ncbi:MAG: acyltransferase family protein [Sarcina sp.]